jgi:hypothetical protein
VETTDDLLQERISLILATLVAPRRPLARAPSIGHLRYVEVDEGYEAFVDEDNREFFLQVGVDYLTQPLWFGPLAL